MTPLAAAAPMEHDALLFEDDDAFVTTLTPWLREGLDRGQAAVVASTDAHNKALGEALGEDAARVTFHLNEDWYRTPATTVAGWERAVRERVGAGAPSVRIVGEVRFGATAAEHARWTRYEAALNRAFAAAPAWIVCPYDVRRLPERITSDAFRTHPTVWVDDRRPSPRYVEPIELFSSVPEPLPPMPDAPLARIAPGSDVAGAREAVRAAAEAIGLSRSRLEDLVVAFSEVAANAVLYGGGIAEASLWTVGDHVVCEVRDRGPEPPDPLMGFVPPAHEALGGMGLWIARQVSTWLVIETEQTGGTIVRFAVDRRG